MEPLYNERLVNFRKVLAEKNLAYFLVTKQENVRYISGFSGDSTWLLLSAQEKLLFTDSRYTSQAQSECPGWEITRQESGLTGSIAKYQKQAGFTSLGVDGKDITLDTYQRLRGAVGDDVTVSNETDPCYELREIKDAWELAQLSQAFSVADRALSILRKMIRPGMNERDIALELSYQLCKCGADGAAFDIIVAAGPQGAWPHAKPGAYKLTVGDFITVDFGAMVNGYRSDMTRTFVLGQPDKTQTERYNLVLKAQEQALAAVKPGVMSKDLDALAREVIVQAGYGEYFGHGLGHGFGLEIHEAPRCSPFASNETLKAGMTLTIEPGIYIPGWGGIRVEDSVVITNNGKEVLTRFPKKLDEMIIR